MFIYTEWWGITLCPDVLYSAKTAMLSPWSSLDHPAHPSNIYISRDAGKGGLFQLPSARSRLHPGQVWTANFPHWYVVQRSSVCCDTFLSEPPGPAAALHMLPMILETRQLSIMFIFSSPIYLELNNQVILFNWQCLIPYTVYIFGCVFNCTEIISWWYSVDWWSPSAESWHHLSLPEDVLL